MLQNRSGQDNSYVLAWTTTPWTLPSNLALCVNPELTYLQVQNKTTNTKWIVGKEKWPWICSSVKKKAEKDFAVLWEKKGAELKGIKYEPLFDYFKGKALEGAWQILTDGYVSTEAGTCIDDNRVCLTAGIILKDGTGMVHPIDDSGCFTKEVSDFMGQHVKAADKDIKEKLKKENKLVFNGTEVHNYPHCWRSDTPLIYRAIPSWFIKVEEAREKLIANNNQTYWVPSFVKEKRFHNWLTEARDWCVSRNRYWGTPIPLWVSSDFEEVVCIGSVAELEKYAGREIKDLHRHFIDDIQIPSQKGKGMLKRVDEVFDCWFESGSMPYGSKHYPFEGKEEFEKGFPAQFIAEGLDQTRGWFYTLMVLGTHLFNKPPFQNLIVNGMVLAADGKKMSKRLKNYPDPQECASCRGLRGTLPLLLALSVSLRCFTLPPSSEAQCLVQHGSEHALPSGLSFQEDLWFFQGTMDKTQKWQCAVLGGSALLYALWLWRKRQRDPFGLDTPVDRRGYKTVKYELSPILFGETARDCLQHWVADMDFPCCPKLRKKLAQRMAHPIYGYTIQPEEVWQAVGRWLVENQNWKKAPEPDCFVFSGTVLASVGSILHTFAKPGDKVLTMVPLYAPLQKVVPASGCSLVQYHLPVKVERGASRYEMDVEGLKKVLDKEKVKFIILCSPHNPVGRVWTREELVALAGVCKDRGILVIVDEVWADLCWKPFTPFHPVAMEIGCKCISLGSPTKTWNLAGFHCSYAIFDDKEMLKRFKGYVEPQFLHHGSTFGTEALQIAYESREWMHAVRAYVETNFCYLEESLKDIPGIELVPCSL
eukprot:s206_g48.t1